MPKGIGYGKKAKKYLGMEGMHGSVEQILKDGHNRMPSSESGSTASCYADCMEKCCPNDECGAIKRRSCETKCTMKCL